MKRIGKEYCEELAQLGISPESRDARRIHKIENWFSDKLQLLSWNPGPLRGLDPSLLARHFNGPWDVVCVQEGSGFVNDQSLAETFYVVTQYSCAVLLNRDTIEPNLSCVPPLLAQARYMGRRGHGCQRPVVLPLHGYQRSHQQRVCQAEVPLHCGAPLDPCLVPQARRYGAHR